MHEPWTLLDDDELAILQFISSPQALSQCNGYITDYLTAIPIPVFDTAGAAKVRNGVVCFTSEVKLVVSSWAFLFSRSIFIPLLLFVASGRAPFGKHRCAFDLCNQWRTYSLHDSGCYCQFSCGPGVRVVYPGLWNSGHRLQFHQIYSPELSEAPLWTPCAEDSWKKGKDVYITRMLFTHKS